MFPNVQRKLPVFQFVPVVSFFPGKTLALYCLFWYSYKLIKSLRAFFRQSSPTLSAFPPRRDASIPPLFLWPFVGLSPSVSMSLVLGCPALASALQVWPHQDWVEGKDPLLWPAGSAAQDYIRFPCCSTAGSCSTCCLPASPGLFPPDCFPALWSPVYAGTWGCPSPGAVLGNSSCWTSWGSCWPVSPACQSSSGWQKDQKCISQFSQFGVIFRPESTLCSTIQITNGSVKKVHPALVLCSHHSLFASS